MSEIMKVNLVSKSQGQRGRFGYRKVYSIIQRDTLVSIWYGRAELPTYQLQNIRKEFATAELAKAWAIEQMFKKLDKGYEMENTNV